MDLKKKLRRVNRGIVLGLAVFFATALYVFIAHRRFVNSTESIKKDADSYIKDYLAAVESDITGVWSDDDKAAQIQEIDKVVDAYWTDKTIGGSQTDSMLLGMNGGMVKKADFKKDYSKAYEDAYVGNVKDVQHTISNAKIKEYGNKGARYTASVTVKMTIPRFMYFPSIDGVRRYYNDLDMENNVWEDESDINEQRMEMRKKGYIYDDTVELSVEYSVEFIYLYTDGEWKISEAGTYSMWGDVISKEDGKKYSISDSGSTDLEDKKNEEVQTPVNAVREGEE